MLRHLRSACLHESDKMTTARLSGTMHVVFVVICSAATLHFAFLLGVADAGKGVQQLRSSINRLNALKQLMNAEQVALYYFIRT